MQTAQASIIPNKHVGETLWNLLITALFLFLAEEGKRTQNLLFISFYNELLLSI